MRNNNELSEMVRASLKKFYKTSIIKRVCAESTMSEKSVRGFFYRKTPLKAFDMMMLLFKYDFLREAVCLALLHNDFYACGNKLGEKSTKNVLLILKNNPTLTFNEIARCMNITSRSVEYEVNKLKRMNLLQRAGGRKKGRWVVL